MEEWDWEFFVGRFEGMEYPQAADYMGWTDEQLKEASAKSRTKKIMSIRRWPKPLSEKQRWCLAHWIADNEAQYV